MHSAAADVPSKPLTETAPTSEQTILRWHTYGDGDTEIGLAPDTHTDGMKRALMAVSGAALAGTKPAGRKRSVSALHLSRNPSHNQRPGTPIPGLTCGTRLPGVCSRNGINRDVPHFR